MKAGPILIVTNALALGAIAMLYMEQDELRSQLGSARGGVAPTSNVQADPEAMEARLLARLRAELAGTPVLDRERAAGSDGAGSDSAGLARPDLPAGEAASADEGDGGLPGDRMDAFRRQVRRANELNREEDQVNGVLTQVEELMRAQRIGALTDSQKERVADTVLASRAKRSKFFREMRANPDLREMPREERGNYFREAMEGLQGEALKALEEVVPAADAQTIADATRGGFGGDRGAARPSRRARRSGN